MGVGETLDYKEHADGNVNVTRTLAQGADLVVAGAPVTLDGLTEIEIEFYCQVVELPRNQYDFNLGVFENGQPVRLLVGRFSSGAGTWDVEAYGKCYLIPAAGEHSYEIRAYRSPGSSGTAIVAAGDGQGTNFPPAFYRVKVAGTVAPT